MEYELVRTGRLAEAGPVSIAPNPVPSAMALDDTHPAGDNTDGVPTEAALIDYLQDVDHAVSLGHLVTATGVSRDALWPRLKRLETRGLIIVSIGLYYVTISLGDGVYPMADGGCTRAVPAIDLDPEQVYMVLSNERRRETLRVLARRTEYDDADEITYTPVNRLAAIVSSSDEEVATSTVPNTGDQHSTYVALSQTHLPLLHDFGVVEYYSRVQKVALTDVGLALAQLMDSIEAASKPVEA